MRRSRISRARPGTAQLWRLGTVVLVAAALALAFGYWSEPGPAPKWNGEERIAAFLSAGSESYTPIEGPWRLVLPRDHGAHPGFQSEIWRFYGHLETRDGRRIGFQLSILRFGLVPERPQGRGSEWAANEVYAGLLAVTDAGPGRFWSSGRAARAALGLSGAEGMPPRLWVEDWEARFSGSAVGAAIIALRAAESPVKLEVTLTGDRPAVPTPGTGDRIAYLVTRLTVEGTIAIGGERLTGSGSAAMEHSWGRLPRGTGQLALDRFLLHLDDGRDLMVQRLSRRDGGGTPVATGLLMLPDGTRRTLGRRDLALEVLGHWDSLATRYPVRWSLALPAEGAKLEVRPYLEAQEIEGPLRHWAGAVRVEGRWRGVEVEGDGYVELLGHDGARR